MSETSGADLSVQIARDSNAALRRLKAALLALPESGENGFEGLIATLLGSVTQVSFRLATSGTQDGQDGRGDGPMGAVSFERSEERRVGKECVSTCRSRWWP